jgi:hypothetical protein
MAIVGNFEVMLGQALWVTLRIILYSCAMVSFCKLFNLLNYARRLGEILIYHFLFLIFCYVLSPASNLNLHSFYSSHDPLFLLLSVQLSFSFSLRSDLLILYSIPFPPTVSVRFCSLPSVICPPSPFLSGVAELHALQRIKASHVTRTTHQTSNAVKALWLAPVCILLWFLPNFVVVGLRSCFVFWRCRVQISAWTPAILTDVFRGFSRSLLANAGIVH